MGHLIMVITRKKIFEKKYYLKNGIFWVFMYFFCTSSISGKLKIVIMLTLCILFIYLEEFTSLHGSHAKFTIMKTPWLWDSFESISALYASNPAASNEVLFHYTRCSTVSNWLLMPRVSFQHVSSVGLYV